MEQLIIDLSEAESICDRLSGDTRNLAFYLLNNYSSPDVKVIKVSLRCGKAAIHTTNNNKDIKLHTMRVYEFIMLVDESFKLRDSTFIPESIMILKLDKFVIDEKEDTN